MDAMDEEHLCRRTPVRHHWVKLADCTEPSGLARRHVREFLDGHAAPERVDDAVLIASELVGNALRHTAGGPDCMSVEVYRDVAVLRVHDAGRDVATVRARSAGESVDELKGSGLGLLIVSELASAWSVRATSIGKEVVAILVLEAGGLPEGDIPPHIPAVCPPFTAEFHQLDFGHGELDRR
ncbi:ATP-binding protein [Streptomyces sp. CB04723]|uniref:ATP-binding protein n=2 Tax=Streptomyces TaxID=1883 RepID=UPI0015C46C48|nr:ATP-binding protein [Streptomyces sp. CB04723]